MLQYRSPDGRGVRILPLRGLGLREAQQAVTAWEAMRAGTGQELAPGEQKRSSGLLWLAFVLLAALIAYAVYRFFGAGG